MYGQWGRVQVPAYNLAGWYDPFVQGNIDMFVGLQNEGGGRAKGNQKLDINATGHGKMDTDYNLTEAAGLYLPQAEQRWFDYWLKGIDNGIMKEHPSAMILPVTNGGRYVYPR
jgi:predicted acyl esterase